MFGIWKPNIPNSFMYLLRYLGKINSKNHMKEKFFIKSHQPQWCACAINEKVAKVLDTTCFISHLLFHGKSVYHARRNDRKEHVLTWYSIANHFQTTEESRSPSNLVEREFSWIQQTTQFKNTYKLMKQLTKTTFMSTFHISVMKKEIMMHFCPSKRRNV